MKLVYFPENALAPKGGPAGYLYSLKLGLDQIGVGDIKFLPPAPRSYEQNSTLRKLVPTRIKDIRRLHNALTLLDSYNHVDERIADYDLIHFHETRTMYLCRQFLEKYEGKVVLTSHSPCVYHKELIDSLHPRDAFHFKNDLGKLSQIDEYAFRRANYVVFPCPEAEEPYMNSWDSYSTVRDEKKIRYLPTGSLPCYPKRDREVVRAEYGIPRDAFVACYAGRHNSIKGYDWLVSHSEDLLKKENTWILIAGKAGSIQPPNHKRWIEVGWTNDVHSIMAAADTFLVPNRETYFDLVLIEAMSLGLPVIASRTGGNRFYERKGCKGVALYDSFDEFIVLFRLMEDMGLEQRMTSGRANSNFYNTHLTMEVFSSGYQQLLDSLV